MWVLNQTDGTVLRINPRTNQVEATIKVGVAGPGGDIAAGNFAFDPLIRLMRPINWWIKGPEGEHSLGTEDLRCARSVFADVRTSDHAVFYTYSRFFAKPTLFNRKVARFLKGMGQALLPAFPVLKRFHSLAFLELRKKGLPNGSA